MSIEDDLRTILRRRATDVPADAIRRVRTVGYTPRISHWLQPPALTVLSGTIVVAAAIGVVMAALGGVSPAFAGWSPTPTAPSPGQLARASISCQAHAPFTGLPLTLTDTRGPFIFLITRPIGNARSASPVPRSHRSRAPCRASPRPWRLIS